MPANNARKAWIAACIALGCGLLLGAGWLLARALDANPITIQEQEVVIDARSTQGRAIRLPDRERRRSAGAGAAEAPAPRVVIESAAWRHRRARAGADRTS
jgi:hypothetical protein